VSVKFIVDTEGNQKYSHGTVRAFDEPRRMYRVSYDDGEEHFEMLDFGVPDICTFKRRTAREDAAAALRAQQQCQLEMQRERAQQLAAAMQLKKKTQKAKAARVRQREKVRKQQLRNAVIVARQDKKKAVARAKELAKADAERQKVARRLAAEREAVELDKSAINRKIDAVKADPDFIPLPLTGSDTQLQDLLVQCLHVLAGELRVKIRHSHPDSKASVRVPLELWPTAFQELQMQRDLVTQGKELVARWAGPPEQFDSFFNPSYSSFGMEFSDPTLSGQWREPVKILCIVNEFHALTGEVVLKYCFGTQQLSISGDHARVWSI
jgi:hypothetical protein